MRDQPLFNFSDLSDACYHESKTGDSDVMGRVFDDARKRARMRVYGYDTDEYDSLDDAITNNGDDC